MFGQYTVSHVHTHRGLAAYGNVWAVHSEPRAYAPRLAVDGNVWAVYSEPHAYPPRISCVYGNVFGSTQWEGGKILCNDTMVSITDIRCHERHHLSNHLTIWPDQTRPKQYGSEWVRNAAKRHHSLHNGLLVSWKSNSPTQSKKLDISSGDCGWQLVSHVHTHRELAVYMGMFGQYTVSHVQTHRGLVVCMGRFGQYTVNHAHAQRGLAVYMRIFGQYTVSHAYTHRGLAVYMRRFGQYTVNHAHTHRGLAVYMRIFGQ